MMKFRDEKSQGWPTAEAELEPRSFFQADLIPMDKKTAFLWFSF